MKTNVLTNTKRLVARLTFRTMRKSAIWFGVFAGGVAAVQASAYVAAYPDVASRHDLVAAFSGNPMLSILYGDPAYALTPAGYIVFRCLNVLLFAAALWSLFAITRMLRGQEDAGRWELLLSGQITSAQAVWNTLRGWLTGAAVSWVICTLAVAAVGHSKDIQVSVQASAYFALVVMTMAVLFAAIGALTSQLASSRRRAIVYGMIPLGIFFILRSVAHLSRDLQWVKNFSPFGWLEHANPIMGSHPLWLLPVVVLAIICASLAVWIASRRDLGESTIAEKAIKRPSFRLLGSPLQVAFRLQRPVLLGWLLATLAMTGITAGVVNTAVDSLKDSGGLSDTLSTISGSQADLALTFISFTSLLAAIVLLFMLAQGISAIRNEEFSSYLDNFLVRPVNRTRWLVGRAVLLWSATAAICIISSIAVWAIARAEGLYINAGHMILESFNIMGPLTLALGVGVLLYSWRPRLATGSVYALLLWSFLIDTFASITDVNAVLLNTSLFRHMAMSPAVHPQWGTFAITTIIGLALVALGVWLFARRDLEVE